MIPVGPQLQALDRSVPHRTRTATSGSKRSPLDLVFLAGPEQQAQDAGPQPQGPDQSVPRQTCTKNLRRYTRLPDRMPERMSEDMPDTYARKNVVRYGIYQVAFVLKNNVRRNARIDARKNVKINAK